MPALSGQIVMTLRNAAGAVIIQTTINYNPSTGALVDAAVSTSRGSQTGAEVIDNQVGRAVHVVQRDAAGTVLRTVAIPAAGLTRTASQLQAQQGATVVADLAGTSFDLA